MTFHILANLDQETKWLGVTTELPRAVRARVSGYAALLAALAPPDEDVVVWALDRVPPDRLPAVPNWRPPTVRQATSGMTADLVWADPAAKPWNDRRFALATATELGCALPGARVIHTLDELEPLAIGAPWVCKALWTSAGRDRRLGTGLAFLDEHRAHVTKLLAHGPVMFEPWVQRICDVAVCGTIDDAIHLEAPHGLLNSKYGGFLGVDLRATHLEVGEHDHLLITVERVAYALQQAGYRGPFGVDAFVYHDGKHRRLHPVCEINARYTFGHVAHALHRRLGVTRLGFDHLPSGNATILVTSIKPPNAAAMAWVQ